MINKEEKKKIMNQIKMVRRVLDFGYERALLYADAGEEEEFVKSLENKTKVELLQESRFLKDAIYIPADPNRNKDADGKFCIRKCRKEFIPRDGNVEIYCSACDRTIAKRPIRK